MTNWMHPATRRVLALALIIAAALTPARAQNDAASRREAIEMMYPVMINALETKNYSRARKICDQVILWEPQNPVHHYNLACIEAQAGGTRIPYAFGALELAMALGFDDVEHLKSDPDLQPLHTDPKFGDIVRKAMHNASADAAISGLSIPESRPKPAATDTLSVFERPAPAAFRDGVPVGLYYLNRYRAATREVEKCAWYFAPDGTVYRNLTTGIAAADLTAHRGPKGQASATAGSLSIRWTDGAETTAGLEKEGDGFTWDEGIFIPVSSFENDSDLAGVYEGESGSAPGTHRLELKADGTFHWTGVSFAQNVSDVGRLSFTGETQGQWSLSGYLLSVTGANGARFRGLTFPVDDRSTVLKPDWLFFGGMVLKRRP